MGVVEVSDGESCYLSEGGEGGGKVTQCDRMRQDDSSLLQCTPVLCVDDSVRS